jgi:hypothetical protein
MPGLADLDLDRYASVEVFGVDSEAPRGTLYDDAVLVRVELPVQAALPGVHHGAQLLRGHGKSPVGVEANRPVRHPAEHYRDVQLDVAAHVRLELETPVVPGHLEAVGLSSQVGAKLHWLAQRVYGRVGHLAGVDEQMVEDVQPGQVVAHAGQYHPGRLGLLPYGLSLVHVPGRMVPERQGIAGDSDGLLGTEHHAPVARHAP